MGTSIRTGDLVAFSGDTDSSSDQPSRLYVGVVTSLSTHKRMVNAAFALRGEMVGTEYLMQIKDLQVIGHISDFGLDEKEMRFNHGRR